MKQPKKLPAKRMARKKKNGVKELLEIIIQTATAAIVIFQRAKPLINHIKKKKNENKVVRRRIQTKSGADDRPSDPGIR